MLKTKSDYLHLNILIKSKIFYLAYLLILTYYEQQYYLFEYINIA
jgi:hypothetical protein